MTQSLFTESRHTALVGRLVVRNARPRVENLNWHFAHDYEWRVTYAQEVSTGFNWPPSWSYGWDHRPRWRQLWD